MDKLQIAKDIVSLQSWDGEKNPRKLAKRNTEEGLDLLKDIAELIDSNTLTIEELVSLQNEIKKVKDEVDKSIIELGL